MTTCDAGHAPPDATIASVIVPTHARPARLARLLDSLTAQDVPGARLEIIVVDDGSPPGARPRTGTLPPGTRLVRQHRQGPAAARNAGAALARGRLLVFVDDDCTLEPGWMQALLDAHADRPLDLLGGTTLNGLPGNLLSDVAESLLGFLDEDDARGGRPLSFVASNNIACARDAFERMGGFDTHYPLAAGEDRAFCRDWRARIGPLSRVPGARALHHHAHDLASFWRQQHNYGRGAALFHAGVEFGQADRADAGATPTPGAVGAGNRRRTFGLPREPAFYARLLTHYGGGPERRWSRRLAALPLVALSQVAVATGLVRERRSRR